MKVLHIAAHEGKFFKQLYRSMAAQEQVASRFVLFPKWLEADQKVDLPRDTIVPASSSQFNSVVAEGCIWADVVLIHGMTRKVGLAIARLPERYIKNTCIVWSVWGFDSAQCDPAARLQHFLPLTAIEVDRFRRLGTWQAELPKTHDPLKFQKWLGKVPSALNVAHNALLDGVRQRKMSMPPKWWQSVAPKLDMYCSLEPQPETFANLKGFRAVYQQGFPYYSLQDVFKQTEGGVRQGRDILVGGRSDPTGNHLDTISLLAGKLDDQQTVYIPLNYGDKEYGDMVADRAVRDLGNSSCPIRNWMSLEDYAQLVSRTGIVLMNQVRGQSLGTEILTMAYGAKLFLRSDNLHAKHFRRLGLSIAAIDDASDTNRITEPLADSAIAENRGILLSHWSDSAVRQRIADILEHAMDLRVGASA